MGQRGWIGMTWPKQHGGHERSSLERYVVLEEMLAAGAPVPALWPAASFTATELGGYKVQLNASQSTDPDGLALKYTWFNNSARIPATSPETEVGPFTPGSTQTFTLEVTTPSGLTATEKTELKI